MPKLKIKKVKKLVPIVSKPNKITNQVYLNPFEAEKFHQAQSSTIEAKSSVFDFKPRNLLI